MTLLVLLVLTTVAVISVAETIYIRHLPQGCPRRYTVEILGVAVTIYVFKLAKHAQRN
jgi:hypothetical protein